MVDCRNCFEDLNEKIFGSFLPIFFQMRNKKKFFQNFFFPEFSSEKLF